MSESLLHETEQGVFGLAEVIQDWNEADLARLRRIAAVVGTKDRAGVTAALALAGSAAQSAFQPFPGDCDFFERVHIKAPTRHEALRTLISVMIETVGHVFSHPDLHFSEMKLGLYPFDMRHGSVLGRKGSPINWTLTDLDARAINGENAEGDAVTLRIEDAAAEPGFVKLDWVYADPDEDRIVYVTKVIDATWEAADGTVIPLDGVVDSFYQEVYLEGEDKQHVERLIEQVAPDGLGQYIGQLEKEIKKYSEEGHENYGKVAKRLYNIFRVTKKHDAAMHVRSLFDDPAARLYQVQSVLHALEPVLGGHRLDRQVVSTQLERMAGAIDECYDEPDKDELRDLVLRLDDLEGEERSAALDRIGGALMVEISDYFEEKLKENPEVNGYLESL